LGIRRAVPRAAPEFFLSPLYNSTAEEKNRSNAAKCACAI
jgi:hypothetical protein